MTSPKKGLEVEKESTLFGDLSHIEVWHSLLRSKQPACLNN